MSTTVVSCIMPGCNKVVPPTSVPVCGPHLAEPDSILVQGVAYMRDASPHFVAKDDPYYMTARKLGGVPAVRLRNLVYMATSDAVR